MKAIAVFLLFIGMFLVVQGYYQQASKCPTPMVEVKYIPRSMYEEQLSDEQKLQVHFKSLFEDVTPWILTKT
jgi:hypothetical protein